MIQLFNADCLQKLQDLSSNSVDCIICDLPFGCLAQGYRETGTHPQSTNPNQKKKKHFTTEACSWDVAIDLEAFWKEIRRIRKDEHTPCLHFTTTKYGFELYNSNPKEFRYDLVWDKGRGVSFLSANKMPMRSHEMVYVFSKAGAQYKRVDVDAPGKGNQKDSETSTLRKDNMFGSGLKRSSGAKKDMACVKSVIQMKKVGTFKQGHPTEKPVELYKFLLQRYCPAGGTVLDPTFGSGNSGLAARDLGLSYIGIEKDKDFFDKAKKKLLPETNNL